MAKLINPNLLEVAVGPIELVNEEMTKRLEERIFSMETDIENKRSKGYKILEEAANLFDEIHKEEAQVERLKDFRNKYNI